MKIVSVNLNGIRAASRKGYLEWIQREQPDIVCMQETKAHFEQLTPEMQQPDGYHAEFVSAEKKGYSGVAIYSKHKPVKIITEFGWEIDPIGFRSTAREIYSRYRLPLIVTENGLGAYDTLTEEGKVHDTYRIEYLRQHIEQIQLAITDGVEMMGYCPWSAIDLVSTHEGSVKRYGFIYVDREEFDVKSLDRYRKDSFFWYKKVIASNGEDL